MAMTPRAGAFDLITVRGIPVRVHWTFFLLIAWVGIGSLAGGGSSGTEAPLYQIMFILALFTCVVLHEFGHALTARRFGINTKDIVLYPIGGVATLDAEAPPKPELFIAAAGPAVNVVLVFLLWPLAKLPFSAEAPIDPADTAAVQAVAESLNFWGHLLIANVILAVFNLIPAFPMDGGRILRAALALLKVPAATQIAARVSQVLSFALGLFAIYIGNIVLILIAAFVFMAAMQEHFRARARSAATNQTVKDIMTDASLVQVFPHGMTVAAAIDIALRSFQPIFPVVHGSQVLGVIDRDLLLQEAALNPEDSYISMVMRREFAATSPQEPLPSLVERIQSGNEPNLLVIDDGKLVGLLFKEKLYEFLMIQGMRQTASARKLADDTFA